MVWKRKRKNHFNVFRFPKLNLCIFMKRKNCRTTTNIAYAYGLWMDTIRDEYKSNSRMMKLTENNVNNTIAIRSREMVICSLYKLFSTWINTFLKYLLRLTVIRSAWFGKFDCPMFPDGKHLTSNLDCWRWNIFLSSFKLWAPWLQCFIRQSSNRCIYNSIYNRSNGITTYIQCTKCTFSFSHHLMLNCYSARFLGFQSSFNSFNFPRLYCTLSMTTIDFVWYIT